MPAFAEVGEGVLIDSFQRDVRLSLRRLIRRPWISLGAMLCLALGIGASVSVFTLVQGVLLKALPFEDSDRLVFIRGEVPSQGQVRMHASILEVQDYIEQAESFSHIVAAGGRYMDLTGSGDPERLLAGRVAPSFFSMLGSKAALGRTFLPQHAEPGQGKVLVLSHELWVNRFGGNPAIVGTKLNLQKEPWEVIGVMPENFHFRYASFETELWVPVVPDLELQSRTARTLHVLARIKPEVSLEQAQAEMDLILGRLRQEYTEAYAAADWHLNVVPVKEEMVGGSRLSLWVLMGLVALVLLIACINTASLLLARGLERSREVAMYLALGANRRGLMAQFVTEGILLGIAGGVVGLFLARWAISAVVSLKPEGIPRLEELAIDGRIVIFGLLAAIVTGALAGMVPALRASRPDLVPALKEGSPGSRGSGHRLAEALVVTEVAFAVLGLVGAGLLVRSFLELKDTETGFQADNLLTFQLTLPQSRYPSNEARSEYLTRILDKLEALPGQEYVAVATSLPFSEITYISESLMEGHPVGSGESKPVTDWRVASSGFFKAMGIPLIQGRTFDDRDTAERELVVVVDQGLARRFWPEGESLGKLVKIIPGLKPAAEEPWRRIIGVVGSIRSMSVDEEPMNQAYTPHTQFPVTRFISVAIRTETDLDAMGRAAKAAIWTLDKDQTVEGVTSMRAILDETLSSRRSYALFMSIASFIALILTAIGVYGVMAQAVNRRHNEIGIRRALGARSSTVLWELVSQGLKLSAVGIGLGITLTFFASRVLSGLLFGVTATDTVTLLGVVLILLVVACSASLFSALRAIQIDPNQALRQG